MKLKSRFFLLGILSMLAITMKTVNAAATGNANTDANADADAEADANAIANANANDAIQPYDDPPNPSGCGEVPLKDKRIIGGQDAKFGSRPWLGILFAKVAQDEYQICGCNLLNTKWCVTAAHCMYTEHGSLIPLGNYFVRFGEHNLVSTSERLPYKKFTFETRKIHSQYSHSDTPYDITMMKVKGTVTYADNIRPICLPKSNVNIFGRTANVAGWGVFNYNLGLTPDILQEVDVQIITDDKCKKWFKEAWEQYYDHSTAFCAGYKQGGRDSCQGDSGGALTVMEGGKYTMVGLVSYGIECGFPNLPGVYTRVQSFVPWILKCME